MRWEMSKTDTGVLRDSKKPTQLVYFIVLYSADVWSWRLANEMVIEVTSPTVALDACFNSSRPLHGSKSWSVVQLRILHWSSDPLRWDQDTFLKSWSVVQRRILHWSSDPLRWDQDTFLKSWSVVQWRILHWSSDPLMWDQDTFLESWSVVQWRILHWSSDPLRWDQNTFSKSWSVVQWRILHWSSDPLRWDQDTFSKSWPMVQWKILHWSSDQDDTTERFRKVGQTLIPEGETDTSFRILCQWSKSSMDQVTHEDRVTTRSQNDGQQAPSGGVQDVFRKSEDLNDTA